MRKLLWISSCFVVCVLVSICVFFWNDIFGYKTLEKAVQSTWKYPLQVVNVDQQNELVLSLDQTQYVFAAYELKNGRYHYDTDSESGWTASSDVGPAFLVQAEPKNNKENFIWGALYSDMPVHKFKIEYTNGETQEVESSNNTFIMRMPEAYQSEDKMMLMTTFTNVYALDEENNVIRAYNLN